MRHRLIVFLFALFAAASLSAQEPPAPQPAPAPAVEPVPAVEAMPPALTREEIEALVEKKVAEKVAAIEEAKNAAFAKASAAKEEETKKAAAAKAAAEKKEKEEAAKKSGVHDKPGMMAPAFSKTSLSFIIGDDNVRDNSQYSPETDVGPKDDYDSFMNKFLGYSNRAKGMSRLTLFHQDGNLIPDVTARIGLAFDLEHTFDTTYFVKTNLYEGGSFIEVQYEKDFLIKLTAWPYDSDRMAVGFFPGLRWGTRAAWPQNLGFVPGTQVLFGWGPISVYAGFKAHLQPLVDKLNEETVPLETTYGGFGGVTYKDFGLTASLQAAFIDKGDNVMIDESALKDTKDDEILSYGLDLFTQYEWGKPIGDPLGLTSYNNGEWQQPDYNGDFAVRARGELIFLNERLQNADYLSWEAGDSLKIAPITDNFWAMAAAVEGAFRWDHLRAFGLFSWRSLRFLVFDAPGLIPFQTFAKGSKIRDEFSGSFAIDYNWRMLWFGISAGIKTPAAYLAPGASRITVVKDRLVSNSKKVFTARNREDLPDYAEPLNIAFYALTIKAQLSQSIMAGFMLSFTKDSNRSKPVPDAETGNNILFWDDEETRNILSFYLSLEGRF